MLNVSSRDRLCQEILGGRLSPLLGKDTIVSIPMNYDFISPEVLFAAKEAAYSLDPGQIRQMLPLVLYAIESKRFDLFHTGYLNAFFLHINYDYIFPVDLFAPLVPGEFSPKYTTEYRPGRVAETISGMNRFEHSWALEWVRNLIQTDDWDVMALFREDLTMFWRILAMALDLPENEIHQNNA